MIVMERRKTPDRRQQTQTVVVPSSHYRCPYCPFEGDESDMIQHAMDCGHIARMADEGCPNG